jgi:hypothetical protein
MPISLYTDIPKEVIYKVAERPYDAAAITAEYQQFTEPSRSLILWLLDLMAHVVMNEAVNKVHFSVNFILCFINHYFL